MQIRNNIKHARKLARHIIANKLTPVFDLDGVLLDATHRQNCNPDGTLNLELYRKNSTPELIAKDKDLALLEAVKILNAAKVRYHVLTARVPCKSTLKRLETAGIRPKSIMGRNGETDHRRDHELKGGHLLKSFSTRARKRMVLIDDNEKNCQTARACGLQSVHVPFKGH